MRGEGRGETRRDDATTWQRWDKDERWDAATRWRGNARGLGTRRQGAERQRNNQPDEQMNIRTDERTKKAGAMWGDDAARQGDGGGRFSAPKAPHSSPLKHCHFGWLLCRFWLEDLSPPMGTPCRMTVIEMRWAKLMSRNDCLISSDVCGYLFFDLVRYMKCTFSLW